MISTTVLIVGAGFGGLAMAHELLQRGVHDFRIVERQSRCGGVWNENRYPGIACDIHSHLYCLSYFMNPRWSQEFAPGEEIRDYLEAFARHLGITDRIAFDTTVRRATYDDASATWSVDTDHGTYGAKYFVSAVGQQHTPQYPRIAGLDGFAGAHFHSARWDEGCDLAGKRVGVIGSAASAAQIIPAIARTAARLVVFQRTPSWVMPKPNKVFSKDELAALAAPGALDRKRAEIRKFWDDFYPGLFYSDDNKAAEARARASMAAQLETQELRDKLIPSYPFLTKRVVLTSEYLPTFNRPNVELVTEPIAEVDGRRVLVRGGPAHELDVLVSATGFHSTHFLGTLAITGRRGRDLQGAWRDGLDAEAYLGAFVHGFPNMFVIFGPNTGVGGSSVTIMIEAQARMIARCVAHVEDRGLAAIEVRREVQDEFNRELHAFMTRLVWTSDQATSWFKTAEGKVTTKWPHQPAEFERRCEALELADFELRPA